MSATSPLATLDHVASRIDGISHGVSGLKRGLDRLERASGIVPRNVDHVADRLDIDKLIAAATRNGPPKLTPGAMRVVRHATLKVWLHGNQGKDIADALKACYPLHAANEIAKMKAAHAEQAAYYDALDAGQFAAAKAISNPATTSQVSWAMELDAISVADFLFNVTVPSIFAQLAPRGIVVEPSALFKIPGKYPGGIPNGSWVEEGHPIGVFKSPLSSVTLTPHKLGAISTFSGELAKHSIPSIESVVTMLLSEDLTKLLDMKLVSADAATAAAPRGLRNGIAPTAQATGTDPTANIAADLKNLSAGVLAGGGSTVLYVMNPQQALCLSLMPGNFSLPVLQSATVPVGMVIALDPAALATMQGGAEILVSDYVVLAENTDAAPISGAPGGLPPVDPAAVTFPVRSAWQTNVVGMRCILDDLDFQMMVPLISWMQDVAW